MNKAKQLQDLIESMVHRLMVVQNRFLQTTPADLSATEMKVITYIGKAGEPIMSEISESLLIAKNNLTAIVDKLVKKDLVIRFRSDHDRRVVIAKLSKQGQEIFDQESQNYLELSKGMLRGLEKDEQDELIRLLKKITES